MTELLFRDDAYQTAADCRVIGHTPEGGILVDRSVFYATGGGQPGDSGMLDWGGTRMPIATVGRNVGFEDQVYFSRVFKKCTGASPSEFRAGCE